MIGGNSLNRRNLLGGVASIAIPWRTVNDGRAQELSGVRILIPDTAMRPAIESLRPRFEAETGEQLVFVPAPAESVEFALREDARSGTNALDGAIVPMWHIGGYIVDDIIQPLDLLVERNAELFDKVDFDDELPAVRRLRRFGNDLMALPIDGDCQLLYCQVDRFSDTALQREFEAETGSPFEPPSTWPELLQIASWWSSRGHDAIALHLGSAGSGIMQFLAMAAAYAVDPDAPGAFWFDAETFEPTLTSERHLTALEDFQRLVSTGSPDQVNWWLPHAWRAFLEGYALFTIAGPDLLAAAIDGRHPRRDRIGLAALPRGDASVGMIGNTLGPCWGGVVRSTTRKPELAIHALAMLAQNDFQIDRGWIVNDGMDPSRASQLPPETMEGGATPLERYEQSGFDPAQARAFADGVETTLNAPVQLPYLRIPGAYDYYVALDQRLHAHISGDIQTAAETLSLAARDFEQLSTIHGAERQQTLYQRSLE